MSDASGNDGGTGEERQGLPPGRKPSGMRFESFVDRQIRLAAERGDFDNLPGAGKPLRDETPRDHGWWIKDYVAREGLSVESLLPPALKLRRELEKLPARAARCDTEEEARQLARAHNRQVAEYYRSGPGSGPNIPVRVADADELAKAWRAAH